MLPKNETQEGSFDSQINSRNDEKVRKIFMSFAEKSEDEKNKSSPFGHKPQTNLLTEFAKIGSVTNIMAIKPV